MKALVKAHAREGLWLQDAPRPEAGANDVLVQVRKTAVCGTDLHIFSWDAWAQKTVPVPMTVGHEFVGHIVEVGSEVRGFEVGDRIAGEGHINCGFCRRCRAGQRHLCRETVGVGVNRTGCFAEFIAIPATNAFKLPDDIPDRVAAMLDPLGNATHTALSFDLVGEDVLITGAGPIGAMATAIAKQAGARHVVVTDINDYRLDLAAAMGATRTVNVTRETIRDAMDDLGMLEGFDVGMEMSGVESAFRAQLTHAVNGGRLALLGIPANDIAIDWNDVIFKGITIKGIYGREMFETWYKMTSLLQSGLDVEPVITHELPYTEFETCFELMRTGQSGKIILDWTA
ncbi:MAG: L-threonine 3-dehydrogenase [Pseudomonadota bacterium]